MQFTLPIGSIDPLVGIFRYCISEFRFEFGVGCCSTSCCRTSFFITITIASSCCSSCSSCSSCDLVGHPSGSLTNSFYHLYQGILSFESRRGNTLFNANVRQIWGAGNWPDLSIWGEARFAGDLLTYPNDVAQTSYWTATNVTATANSIANPADNQVTASKLMETVTSGQHNEIRSLRRGQVLS